MKKIFTAILLLTLPCASTVWAAQATNPTEAVGVFQTDTINENTSGAGVTADGVKLKDSQVYTDQINEKTSAAGVTIDGLLIKDSTISHTVVDFVPVSQAGILGQSVHGNHPILPLDGVGETAYMSWRVPQGFTALTSGKVVVIPTTTGTFDWTVNTSWGALTEDEAGAVDTATADGKAATDDVVTAVDCTAAFTGIAAGDFVGIAFVLDALATTTEVNFLGIELTYTRNL